MVARTRGQLAVVHGAQLTAQRLLGNRDLVLLPQPLAPVDQPPAHDAMHRRHRPALDHRCDRRPVRIREPGRLARRLAVDEAFGATGIQLQHPVPNDLQRHAADRGSLRAGCPVIDGSQGQKTPGLRPILRLLGNCPQLRRVEIGAKWNRHGKPPGFAAFNQTSSGMKTLKGHDLWDLV